MNVPQEFLKPRRIAHADHADQAVVPDDTLQIDAAAVIVEENRFEVLSSGFWGRVIIVRAFPERLNELKPEKYLGKCLFSPEHR